MDVIERIANGVADHSKAVIAVVLVLTAVVGYGAPMVEQKSGLSQFESESEAASAQEFVTENFRVGDENTTSVQIIVRDRDGNVLSKASLVESLRYQMALRDRKKIARTLVGNRSTFGVANFVATVAIGRERLTDLQQRRANLSARAARLNATAERLNATRQRLTETRRQLQARSEQLNATARNLSRGLARIRLLQHELDVLQRKYNESNETYQRKAAAIRDEINATIADATAPLNGSETRTYRESVSKVRDLQRDLDALNASFRAGEIDRSTYRERANEIGDALERVIQGTPRTILREEYARLERRSEQLRAEFRELRENYGELRNASEELEEDSAALRADFRALRESPPDPTLNEQLRQLRSMNASEIDAVVTDLLSADSSIPGSERALELLPKGYEPGSTTASARMMIVVQRVESAGALNSPNTLTDRIVTGQLAMQDLANRKPYSKNGDYIVFGGGVITDEIDQSLSDTALIVGPLAVLFVLVTLLIAYRDLLDIALGLLGIFMVLLWTWGFMGWVGIPFNQIMIAVPVLLIGLSIDYAIHIFMRHRETRLDDDVSATDPRGSMRTALAGVGLALIWVTATTVIGFLSNVISPLPPIRQFGYASSAGITATLLIFGAFIPALKVELDEFLEGLGLDRTKRAFGTGGGAFSSVLSVGATAARTAPWVVILAALVVTAAGAYGGSQVDTSFEQEDFLAEDPPGWMDRLPEPFAPGEYSAKEHLDYVYANFQSPDQQAQILIRDRTGGPGIASTEALHRLHDAQVRAAEKSVTYVGPAGTDITSPLTVMHEVAANNASFNETFQAADTDGDGVPEQNVSAVLDELFEVAPQQAGSVIYRTDDGSYAAYRMRIALEGTATSGEVTAQFRDLADAIEKTNGVTATATGAPIVNEVVQGQLLETVINSLLVTLVAIFAFLMIAYRLTEGSATLGIVTLLPVALSVAWILGTMYLVGIPFNAVTGTITSLTVGLGVAYSIHLSERYNLELQRRDDVWTAMRKSVTGTGGALLGSAATTAGGFGVLAFAIFPALQQFGIITAITIVYAFLGSVFVLPSMLVVWTRYLGPDVDFEPSDESGPDEPDDAGTADDASPTETPGSTPAADGDSAAEDPLAPGDDAAGEPGDGADAPEDGTAATAGDAGATEAEGSAEATGNKAGTDAPEGETDADDGVAAPGDVPLASGSDAPESAADDAEVAGAAPGDGAAGTAGDGDDGTAAAPDSDDAVGRSDDVEPDGETASTAAPATDDADGVGGATGDGTGAPAGASAAAGAASPDPDVERSVAPTTPEPGETLTVSVVARDLSGTVALKERVPGTGGRIESVDPEPLTRAKDGRTVYLVWRLDEPGDVGITYATEVPDDASAGETLDFEGTLDRPEGTTQVGGDRSVTVATPFVADLEAADRIEAADVEAAARKARNGDLTGDAFERIYRRWLREEGGPDGDVADRVAEELAGDLADHDPDSEAEDASGSRPDGGDAGERR